VAATEADQIDRRGRRREAKRATILAEAWTLAHRDGLAAISLRDLADRVDLRQPSLYAYFDSKLDLYDQMFADGNRQLLELVRSLAPSDDPRDALVELTEALVRFSTEDVVRHQLLFQRTIPGFEPSPASYALAVEFYEIARQRLTAAGGSDPSDVDIFSALVSGLAHQQVANDPGGDRWVRLAGRAVDMFLTDVDRRQLSRIQPSRTPKGRIQKVSTPKGRTREGARR
jgi:AcrR family transcriptional regulator